jgi:hypothetical protein
MMFPVSVICPKGRIKNWIELKDIVMQHNIRQLFLIQKQKWMTNNLGMHVSQLKDHDTFISDRSQKLYVINYLFLMLLLLNKCRGSTLTQCQPAPPWIDWSSGYANTCYWNHPICFFHQLQLQLNFYCL